MRLLLLALLLAGTLGVAGRIITRHDIPDRAYVELAADLEVTRAIVRYNSTDVAGTLIAPDWLLSAAHVAETIEPGRMLISFAADSVEVSEVILHPGWIEDGRPEDIALIRLQRGVENAPFVPIYDGQDEAGMEVTIVGNGDFGTGLTGPTGNDGRMRAATNRVDEATDNYLIWSFDPPDSKGATRLEGVSGPGDSAGPAFVHVGGEYYLAAISSAQSTSATGGQEGHYGVTEYYSRVSTYRVWIESALSR